MRTPFTTAFGPALPLKSASIRAWQKEVESYYQNYRLLETVLHQSVGLPSRITGQYRALQRDMKTTMVKLMAELDTQVNNSPGFFSRHTHALRKINKQVGSLLLANHQ